MCKHDLSFDLNDIAGIWEALLEDWKQNKVCESTLVGRKHAHPEFRGWVSRNRPQPVRRRSVF
jgi:hypothetical protein